MNASLALLMAVFTGVPGVGSDEGDTAATAIPEVEAWGACPSGPAVMAALLPVLGGGPVHSAGTTPRVADLGDRFEASAAGQTGLYVDAGRDCTERARVAAVFIALALNPPTIQSGTVAPRPAVPPPAVPATGHWFQLGAAVRVDGASVGHSPAAIGLAWGGELRAGLGRGAFGAFATAGALVPTVSQYSLVAVQEQRFPVSLAFRARRDIRGRVQLAGDLGLSAALLTFRGQALQTTDSLVRLDVGARLALALRFPPLLNHVAPTIALHVEYFPRPYALDVDPVGSIGSSSRLWLGASLGLAYEVSSIREK